MDDSTIANAIAADEAEITLGPPPFVGFPKIPRLRRECTITEKVDGTNASVLIQDGQVYAASRKRWITPEDDNFGFARWVERHREELVEGLGEGHHFGEWWGSGIQRRYGFMNGERFWSLFNTHRWGPEGTERDSLPACCLCVPIIFEGMFLTSNTERAISILAVHGSRLVPDWDKPEGIVIYHHAARQSFKQTLGDDGFKGEMRGV